VNESFNVEIIGNYEARVKDRLVTVLSEADRQREIWNLSNKAQKSLREAAGLNKNEHICSIVRKCLSNEVNGCVELIYGWRRHHQISTKPVRISEHPGVTVLACGEGYSRQDGRDCIAPMRLTMYMELIKCPNADSIYIHGSREVRMTISGSETTSHGVQPVRRVHSSDEFSVMEMDAKGPDFCKCFPNSSWLSELPDRESEGIEHERQR